MHMEGGSLYQTDIVDIHKGSSGNPGEMTGMIIYSGDIADPLVAYADDLSPGRDAQMEGFCLTGPHIDHRGDAAVNLVIQHGRQRFQGPDGVSYSPGKYILKSGDYVRKVNGQAVRMPRWRDSASPARTLITEGMLLSIW